jgi:hypothetical protein
MHIIAGKARCFFGDLDAAYMDLKTSNKKALRLTIEKLSPKTLKFKPLLSKSVSLKSFNKGISINASKLKDGVYGVFVCGDGVRSCVDKSIKPAVINNIVYDFLDSAKNPKKVYKNKVYSFNAFIKKGKELIGSQKVSGIENTEKGFKEYLSYMYDENIADGVWKEFEVYYISLNPNPIFKRMNEDGYEGLEENDITVEIPMMDREACEYKVMLDFYRKQRQENK